MKYYVLLVLIHLGIILTCETPTNNTANFKKYEAEVSSPHITLEYDSKGLQPFFNLANSFMNTVQPKSFGEEFKGSKFLLHDILLICLNRTHEIWNGQNSG